MTFDIDGALHASNEVALQETKVEENFTTLGFDPQLAAIRAKNPFMEIVAFPNDIASRTLAPGVPIDVNVPDGCNYLRITSDGHFFMSRNGRAGPPPAMPDFSLNVENGSMVDPVGFFIYVRYIQSLSFYSTLGCNISLLCYSQEG